MAELTLHDNYKAEYPIYVDFKNEEIRDSFNAAIKES